MKTLRRLAFPILAVLALLSAGCRLKDVRTVTLHASGVRCPDCARAVIRSLAAIGEVSPDQSVAVDEERNTASAFWKPLAKNNTAAVSGVVVHYDSGDIDVTYDSMKLAIKNLEFAVAAAGYDVQSEPYDIPGADVPDACKHAKGSDQ